METSQRFWNEQADWSQTTFGLDIERGPLGPLKHLEKEAREAQAEAGELTDHFKMEIADCQFLVFDAARRAGMTHDELFRICFEKLEINKKRKWNVGSETDTCEHVREDL